MLREVIIAPVVIVLILGFAIQLVSVAEDASAKVLNYADDMNNALDCAFDGISIYECSPNLPQYDFKEDVESYREINSDFLAQLKKELNNTGNETIIVYLDVK